MQQGVNVRMDVKQLIGVPEYNDDDKIPYLASLVWSIKEDTPCDQDMCSSRSGSFVIHIMLVSAGFKFMYLKQITRTNESRLKRFFFTGLNQNPGF